MKISVINDVTEYITRNGDPDDEWDRDSSGKDNNVKGIEIVPNNSYSDIEVGFDAKPSKTDVLRNLKGSIFQSLNIKSSIGETVQASTDFIYGKADTITTSLVTPTADDVSFPYTFAHATLDLPDGTEVAEVQDFDITFNTNAELLYEQGDANAVGAFRKLFEMTCKLNASFIDKTQLQRVIDRTELATLTVEFTNGLSGTSEKTIKIEFAGVGISEHSLSIAPTEPIFEDLTFQMRNVKVTANNSVNKTVSSGDMTD